MVQLAGVCPGKGLDRHVLPLGTPVALNDSGFLDVAMADALQHQTSTRHAQTLHDATY
jgi:hypothetical protein